MFDRDENYTQSGARKTYDFTVMHAASVTAADTDGDGVDEIIACGYKSNPKVDYVNGVWDTVYKVCDWDKENYAVSMIGKSDITVLDCKMIICSDGSVFLQ